MALTQGLAFAANEQHSSCRDRSGRRRDWHRRSKRRLVCSELGWRSLSDFASKTHDTCVSNVATYVDTAYSLLNLSFTGLTAGPRTVSNGVFTKDILFGTTANGDVFAFNNEW